jgi:glycine cleavage system aminomethyltransferase T
VARFYDYGRTKKHVTARTSEGFIKTYGIVHPREQWESNRRVRVSPFYERAQALGAVFFETAGWERPQWYESNKSLLDEYSDRVLARPHEWDARWWSPIISAEHLAMRDRVAMVDLTAFAIFDVAGPGSLDYIQKMAVNQMDVSIGRAVYTPLLNQHGGFKADLTIMRRDENEFRIVTGGGDGGRDKKWFLDNLPDDGSVHFVDMTSTFCTVGLWGPHARDVLGSVTEDDVTDGGFPFATAKYINIDGIPVWALRISYVGELGWEIYTAMEHGLKLWDTLWTAGQSYGMTPAGIGVYGTSARIEKGYRLMGAELDGEYNPVEADLARPKVKLADFIGREAYFQARKEGQASILSTLTVDDHISASGDNRYMQGREPILTPNGEPIIDRKGRRSYVTSAGTGPSVGKHILMSYLPPDYAKEGSKLAVEYMTELYPVTVAVVGSKPLFDPDNKRMKC